MTIKVLRTTVTDEDRLNLPSFSPSQIDVWMECPQEWDYSYVERLKKRVSVGRHLDVGNYFHELSHVMFNLIKDGHTAGGNFIQDFMTNRIRKDLKMVLESNHYEDAQKIHLAEIISHVSKMMDRYIRVQSKTIDAGILVLEVEKHLEVVVETPMGREVIIHGYADLIYRSRSGKLRLRDHKTGANRGTWHQKKLPLLSQLLDYAIIYQLTTQSTILDVEISYINSYDWKKKEPTKDEAFGYYPHEHNEAALNNAADNLIRVVDLMLDRKPYRRLNSDCSNCSYFDLCDRELRGFSSVELKRTNYEKVSKDNEFKHPKLGEESSTKENSKGNSASQKSDNFVLRWNGVSA